MLAALVALNSLVNWAIPIASVAVSAVVGGVMSRILVKHVLGHVQFQQPPAKQLTAFVTLIVLGTLRLNRKNRGGPLFMNPALLVWVLPLAALQIVSLIALYIWVRNREIASLGQHAVAAKVP